MQRELGITFIHVTHTQLEAIALADLVVVMEKGKIKQAGAAREVYAEPKDRYVAEFLGGQNVLSGKVRRVNGTSLIISAPDANDITVPLDGGQRAISDGEQIDVAVRRDDIDLRRPGAASVGADWNTVNARIRAIEYQGSFVKVMLEPITGGEFVVYMSERQFFSDPFDTGDIVVATWPAERSRLLA